MDPTPDSLAHTPATAAMVALGRRCRFAAGTLVVAEGDPGDCLYIVLSGRVRIFVDADAAAAGEGEARRFVIGTYGPGTLFGEGSLDGGPRTASVEAVGEIECAVLAYAELRAKLATDPQFAMALTMELITRSRLTARRLKGLALGTVYERFRDLAQREAVESDGVLQLPPEWSQQEIANRIGASRDMVTRILRDLGKGGYVHARRGRIALLKPLPKRW